VAPFFLVLCACSLIDPHNMIGRQMGEAKGVPTEPVPSPPTAGLGREAREKAFDFVWGTINEHYYDPKFHGADWRAVGERYQPLALAAPNDEAFWDVLDRMTGELRDAHTRVESPVKVELRHRDESITLGFSFLPIGDKFVVSSVFIDADAWWAGVRSGMTVVSIDGVPARQAYEKLQADTRFDSTPQSRHQRALRRLLFGEVGSKVTFTFERPDGSRFTTTLRRQRLRVPPTEVHRILPSGFGYLRFTEWTIPLTMRALEGLSLLKDTPGIVIDLRGNPGGAALAVNLMLERFYTERTETGRVITRTGKPVSLFFGTLEIIKLKRVVEGSTSAYRGPVVVLMNAQSASASELFAGTMQATGRAKVVGQASCGCLLGFLGYAHVPGGAELAYSEVGFELSNGKHIEGEGVIPDVPVPIQAADLQVNRDRALEEAQALLASEVEGRAGKAVKP
jgi:carboxyl-terminal processing protease